MALSLGSIFDIFSVPGLTPVESGVSILTGANLVTAVIPHLLLAVVLVVVLAVTCPHVTRCHIDLN
jgi:hypothetical protein